MQSINFFKEFHFTFMVIVLLLIHTNSWAFSLKSKLVFSADPDGNWDLFIVDEDGKDLTRLTKTPYDEKEPCWSKDKTKILYAASDGKLHMIDVATRKKLELPALNDVPGLSPTFSPDGNKVAFAQFIPGKKDDTDLMILDIKSGKIQILIHQYAAQFWPTWSPDGNRIAYINSHCSGDCGRLIQEIWLADPRGGWARQLLLTNSFCREPTWSPDGKRIAFSSDKDGNFDIWVLDLGDWSLRKITKFKGLDITPAWSPDGKKIAFISTRSGKMEIWIKDLKTHKLKILNPFPHDSVECKDVDW